MTASSYDSVASSPHTHPWREALADALLAVAAGGIWSLAVGWATGHPLQTWTRLGTAIASIVSPGVQPSSFVAVVCLLVVMTLFFTLISRVAVAIAHSVDKTPGLIMFWILLTTLFLLATVAVTMAFNNSRLGPHTWLQTFGSGLIAVIALTSRVVLRHPAVRASGGRITDDDVDD